MTELFEIKGKWKPKDFDENDAYATFKGNLLLEEDGWFEGIVNSPLEEDMDVFIFGVYEPDQQIEMHEISPTPSELPILFNGIRKGEGYVGKYNIEGYKPKGTEIVETKIRDDLHFLCDAKDLEKRIERFKTDFLLKSKRLSIYDKAHSMRKSTYGLSEKCSESSQKANSEVDSNKGIPFYLELERLFKDTHTNPVDFD